MSLRVWDTAMEGRGPLLTLPVHEELRPRVRYLTRVHPHPLLPIPCPCLLLCLPLCLLEHSNAAVPVFAACPAAVLCPTPTQLVIFC